MVAAWWSSVRPWRARVGKGWSFAGAIHWVKAVANARTPRPAARLAAGSGTPRCRRAPVRAAARVNSLNAERSRSSAWPATTLRKRGPNSRCSDGRRGHGRGGGDRPDRGAGVRRGARRDRQGAPGRRHGARRRQRASRRGVRRQSAVGHGAAVRRVRRAGGTDRARRDAAGRAQRAGPERVPADADPDRPGHGGLRPCRGRREPVVRRAHAGPRAALPAGAGEGAAGEPCAGTGARPCGRLPCRRPQGPVR